MAFLQGWPLRGVPLYNHDHMHELECYILVIVALIMHYRRKCICVSGADNINSAVVSFVERLGGSRIEMY